jgi:amino acid transporter
MSEATESVAGGAVPSPSSPPPAVQFGTFLGVYTPSVLTILGLIMYLRFGWVVGNLGLPLTILVVLVSSSITFLTGLSASALATNMRVGVGGEYFMVAHSLGLELGGTIGIPLFLCRTLSITFYAFGLAESVLMLWPDSWGAVPSWMLQAIAATIIVAITAISGRSAELALKLQIPIMIAVGLSLVALAAGVLAGGLRGPETQATFRTAPEGFWYVFAVFFPAVTGFTAGIGMSGDLKDPRHSIPRGTLLAVATGATVYVVVPILLASAAGVSLDELAVPGVAVWTSIAVLGAWVVYPGMWGAILSSAFGSVLGGPRVLQALASDGLAPRVLANVSRSGQPTVATWVCGALALTGVALGGLNAVAQFVSVLFLTLYVAINMSAGVERLVGDPSFRPTIRVPWALSFLGALGAIFVMFLISPLACLAAISLELILYFYLRRRSLQRRWGDVRAGLWLALARFSLMKLRLHADDPRNWRPHILVFAGDAAKRIGLVRLANWFNQDRGIVTVCQLVEGDLSAERVDLEGKLAEMDRTLSAEGLLAFSEVNVVSDFEDGVIDVAQANGIAGLQSNTVMFGWSKEPDRLESHLRMMRGLSRAQISTLLVRLRWHHEPGTRMRIDLWWGGLENNGDMMLLLAHLLSLNPEFTGARILIRSIARSEEERQLQAAGLAKLAPQVRIAADTEVLTLPDGGTIPNLIHSTSAGADVTFFGLRDPEPGEEADYAMSLRRLAEGLGTTVFVRNASEFSGRLI